MCTPPLNSHFGFASHAFVRKYEYIIASLEEKMHARMIECQQIGNVPSSALAKQLQISHFFMVVQPKISSNTHRQHSPKKFWRSLDFFNFQTIFYHFFLKPKFPTHSQISHFLVKISHFFNFQANFFFKSKFPTYSQISHFLAKIFHFFRSQVSQTVHVDKM